MGKQVRVRRFKGDGRAVCWGRYLYCWTRRVWVRVGCDSTGYSCCAPESLPRGSALPGVSRMSTSDAVEFERLCGQSQLDVSETRVETRCHAGWSV